MAAELGLEEIPSGEDSLQASREAPVFDELATWVDSQGFVTENSIHYPIDARSEIVSDVFQRAYSRPWTNEQIPPLASWIVDNQPAIDLLVEASQRTHYYSPSPSLLDQTPTVLFATLLPGAQGLRDVARVLSLRAMWHLGEGRLDESWNDIQAMHRVAQLSNQDQTLVEQLVSIAIQGLACDATVTLLSDERLSEDQARTIQLEIAELQRYSLVESLALSERLMCLDSVVAVRKYGPDSLSDAGSAVTATKWKGANNIDWNLILTDINLCYDRIIAALDQPTWVARTEAIKSIEAEMDDRTDVHPSQAIFAVFSRKARSQLMSHMFASLMLPALSSAHQAEARINSQLKLIQVAAALAVYRTQHDNYPETLAAMMPNVIPKLPLDLYYETPLVYRRVGAGYLLYSTGPNGQDDGASNQQIKMFQGQDLSGEFFNSDEQEDLVDEIPHGADDIVVSAPRPLFEFPVPVDE
jgi:hypothetical protein